MSLGPLQDGHRDLRAPRALGRGGGSLRGGKAGPRGLARALHPPRARLRSPRRRRAGSVNLLRYGTPGLPSIAEFDQPREVTHDACSREWDTLSPSAAADRRPEFCQRLGFPADATVHKEIGSAVRSFRLPNHFL